LAEKGSCAPEREHISCRNSTFDEHYPEYSENMPLFLFLCAKIVLDNEDR